MLAALLKERGLSQSAFARKVGLTPSRVSQVVNELELVPKRQAAKWADVIGLHGEDREHFLVAALVPHCPPEIQRYIEKLRRSTSR